MYDCCVPKQTETGAHACSITFTCLVNLIDRASRPRPLAAPPRREAPHPSPPLGPLLLRRRMLASTGRRPLPPRQLQQPPNHLLAPPRRAHAAPPHVLHHRRGRRRRPHIFRRLLVRALVTAGLPAVHPHRLAVVLELDRYERICIFPINRPVSKTEHGTEQRSIH